MRYPLRHGARLGTTIKVLNKLFISKPVHVIIRLDPSETFKMDESRAYPGIHQKTRFAIAQGSDRARMKVSF